MWDTLYKVQYRWYTMCLQNVVLFSGLLTLLSVWSSWGEPVVILPAEWVWPVGWFLSSPGVGVSGGVSLPAWMALCRNVHIFITSKLNIKLKVSINLLIFMIKEWLKIEMWMFRTSYKMLPSFPSVFSAPNYSQLPLD